MKRCAVSSGVVMAWYSFWPLQTAFDHTASESIAVSASPCSSVRLTDEEAGDVGVIAVTAVQNNKRPEDHVDNSDITTALHVGDRFRVSVDLPSRSVACVVLGEQVCGVGESKSRQEGRGKGETFAVGFGKPGILREKDSAL
jgi:hypothetical protein